MPTCWRFRTTPAAKPVSNLEGFNPDSNPPTGNRSTTLELAQRIRIRDASGAYRVMYVAKFEEAIYVLHCFQKKTQATSKQDKAIAEARYRAVAQSRKAEQ